MKMSIHSVSAQDRFLRRTFCFFLVVILLVITAHRLPAPITELPESPTPSPAQEEPAKPKSKTSKSKSRDTESEGPAKRQPSEPAKPQPKPPQDRFAGTWVGTINQGVVGNVQFTLVINPGATEVKQTSPYGTYVHPGTSNGKTVTWKAGFLGVIVWTLTPNDDGRTALATAKSGSTVNGTATFQRTQSWQAAQSNPATKTPQPSVRQTTTTATPKETEVPVARPVPDKPGFVYNPFDSNTKVLLDVRGKASGTKVKDPSGRLFIIP